MWCNLKIYQIMSSSPAYTTNKVNVKFNWKRPLLRLYWIICAVCIYMFVFLKRTDWLDCDDCDTGPSHKCTFQNAYVQNCFHFWPLLPNRTNGQQFNYEAHFPLIFIRRRGIITGVCSAGPLWIRLFVVGQRWRHWLESSVRSENNKLNTKQVILRAIFEGASLLNMWQKRRREFASSFVVLFLINYLFSNRTI